MRHSSVLWFRIHMSWIASISICIVAFWLWMIIDSKLFSRKNIFHFPKINTRYFLSYLLPIWETWKWLLVHKKIECQQCISFNDEKWVEYEGCNINELRTDKNIKWLLFCVAKSTFTSTNIVWFESVWVTNYLRFPLRFWYTKMRWTFCLLMKNDKI